MAQDTSSSFHQQRISAVRYDRAFLLPTLHTGFTLKYIYNASVVDRCSLPSFIDDDDDSLSISGRVFHIPAVFDSHLIDIIWIDSAKVLALIQFAFFIFQLK